MFYFYTHTKREVHVSAGELVVTGDGGGEEREAVDIHTLCHSLRQGLYLDL